MLVMKDKENKDKFQEPISDYQVNENSEVDSDEIHHVLKQLLEQSLKEADKGLGIPPEEVMAEIKRKFNWSF